MARLFELQCWVKRFYREGPDFHRYLAQLEESAHFTQGRLRQYQNEYLQRMIRHCYDHVPYYQTLFRRLKLSPDDVCTVQDLQKLPLLTKQEVQDQYDRLIARGRKNWLCRTGHTSGSTGTPGKFLRDYQAINFENAAVWRHWRRAGDYGKRRVTLRGDLVIPPGQQEPPFWKHNPANRELLMSSYHLSLQNSSAYIEKIRQHQPAVLYAYPSTGYLLAKLFETAQESYPFELIFTSSESLDKEARHLIERQFQCRIYDWYGQAERVAALAQCAYGQYHIQEDYSVVEMRPDDHGYELVGTHLFNFVMPLLRYRTNDRVEPDLSPCACGSRFRVVRRILGRHYGYLLTPEGYRISITNHIPRGVDNLLETQFYQDNPGEVTLHIITNGRFTTQDRAKLVRNTLQHTSPRMKVNVKEVHDIPRGPNGKFLGIVNTIESFN